MILNENCGSLLLPRLFILYIYPTTASFSLLDFFFGFAQTLCNSKFRTTFPLGPSLVAQPPNVNFTTV